MEARFCAVLCILDFLSSTTIPFIVSIMFWIDASVRHVLFAMSVRFSVSSCLMDFSLYLLSLLLKCCLFLLEVCFLFRVCLFCNPIDTVSSCLNIPLLPLFLPESLTVLLVWTLFFFTVFVLAVFVL